MTPDLSAAQWILGILCALLVGFSKTGIAGMGIVIVPIMAAVFPPRESTGALLLMLIVGDCFAVAWYRRHAVWKILIALLPWVLPGIVLGWLALDRLSDVQLKPALGVLILALVALQLVFTRTSKWMEERLPHAWWFVSVVGVVAGFATMLGNAAGAVIPIFLIVKGMKKDAFMGTSAWFFLLVNLIKVPFSANLDLANRQTLTFAAMMIPAITVGAFIGVKVLPHIPQKVFNWIVMTIAVLASVRLVVNWP
jgi:uncharacterized protein